MIKIPNCRPPKCIQFGYVRDTIHLTLNWLTAICDTFMDQYYNSLALYKYPIIEKQVKLFEVIFFMSFLKAFPELPFVFVLNESSLETILIYENAFHLYVHFDANQSHFHEKSFGRGLVLKQRKKGN